MLEKDLERKATGKAKRRGWASQKIGVGGKPDRIYWQRRVYIWCEFKIWPNKPTPLQERKIRELRESGEEVVIAYTEDDILSVLAAAEWWRNDRSGVDTGGL